LNVWERARRSAIANHFSVDAVDSCVNVMRTSPGRKVDPMSVSSTRKPVYAVIGFSRTRGGVSIDPPRAAQGEESAKRMAERLAGQCVGAIAISRVGDLEIGEFDDPVEVAR